MYIPYPLSTSWLVVWCCWKVSCTFAHAAARKFAPWFYCTSTYYIATRTPRLSALHALNQFYSEHWKEWNSVLAQLNHTWCCHRMSFPHCCSYLSLYLNRESPSQWKYRWWWCWYLGPRNNLAYSSVVTILLTTRLKNIKNVKIELPKSLQTRFLFTFTTIFQTDFFSHSQQSFQTTSKFIKSML